MRALKRKKDRVTTRMGGRKEGAFIRILNDPKEPSVSPGSGPLAVLRGPISRAKNWKMEVKRKRNEEQKKSGGFERREIHNKK